MILQTIKGVSLLLAIIFIISSCGNNPQTNMEQITHQRIAFNSGRDGDSEIYAIGRDGKNRRNLTQNPGDDESARWSLDGTKIAFQSNRNDDYDIYIMDADGSNQRRLTEMSGDEENPHWSPDGSQIVFNSNINDSW